MSTPLPKPLPPACALDDPEFRKQVQGLKDVTAAINRTPTGKVVFSTDHGQPQR